MSKNMKSNNMDKMDKECCGGSKAEKGMNRTEFAQEYSLDNGKQNCDKQLPCKNNKCK